MDILEKLKARVRTDWQRIVLPEGEDPRVIAAAAQIVKQGYASVTLLGREAPMRAAAARAGVSLDGVKLLDPASSPALGGYARILHERRRSHGLTLDEASQMVRRPLYFAALAVAAGDADGTVGGAANTTAETVRAALHSIGLAPQAKLVSSFFLMILPQRTGPGAGKGPRWSLPIAEWCPSRRRRSWPRLRAPRQRARGCFSKRNREWRCFHFRPKDRLSTRA